MAGNVQLRRMDRVLKWLSIATLTALAVTAVLRRLPSPALPVWWTEWTLPVLTAAAVGYLTNYLAIWMLFRPYEPKRLWHWRFQGVIPRHKEEIGRLLGEEIPRNLLDPEAIAEEVGELVGETLADPEVVAQMRWRISRFALRYREEIAGFITPYVELALRRALRENLTPEHLHLFYDRVVAVWLDDPTVRSALASGVVEALRKRTPELVEVVRDNLRSGVRDYMREEWQHLSRLLAADRFAVLLVDSLNWSRIEAQLGRKLETEETREAIAAELSRISEQVRAYLESPDAAETVERFLAGGARQMEAFLHEYLAEKLPEMTERLFVAESFWNLVHGQLLPVIRTQVDHYLRREGREAILRKLDLGGRIERAVAAQDVRRFHRMILRVSGEHLLAIQVLGFFLGMLAGAVLVFA